MSDPLQESADLLEVPGLDTIRKVEVIRKLLKFRKDPRVGKILRSRLGNETDPEVLKTIILGFGYIKDPRYLQDLVPFLDHTSFRVMAATIKAICKIDAGQESELAHALLVSKDGRARTASILALLSHDKNLGLEAIGQLAASHSEVLRRTAVQCIESDPQATSVTALEMFETETSLELIEALGAVLERAPDRGNLERLYALKARLLGPADTTIAQQSVNERKLQWIEDLTTLYKTRLAVSSDGVGTLEGRLEKELDAARSQNEQREDERVRDAAQRRATARSRRHGVTPVSRAALIAVAGIAVLGGVLQWTIRGRTGDSVRTVGVSRASQVDRTSALGKIGDPVRFEGHVMRVFRSRSAVTLQSREGVIALTTFSKGLPKAAASGLEVFVEGSISGVRSERSIYIDGTSLRLANVPD